MKFRKFVSELNRRNVFKAIIAYLAIAWVIIQIASIVLPAFDAPDYSLKVLIYLLGFGLIFWGIFSWIYDLTSEGFKKTEDISNFEEVSKLTNQRLNKVIVGSLTLAVLLLIVLSFWAGSQWNKGLFESESKKVAVLPLELHKQEQDDVLAAGMTGALIEELSKVDELTLIHQNSTKLMTPTLSQANMLISGEINDVDYFISGDVEHKANTLSARIQLKENLESDPTWSKSYSDDISQARNFWAQIARDLTKEMGIELKPKDSKLLSNLKPINPESYELYLRGKQHIIQSTIDKWYMGLAYLQQAIDKNPVDSYAWAWQAEGYITIGHDVDPPIDVFPKARESALRAIQLDSTNAVGWAALAHYHTYFGWDWDLAEYAFNKANELNPNLAYNHYHRAWFLALFGRMDEAIEAHKLAQKLDPFTPKHTAWLGGLYRMTGNYEKALEEAEKTMDMVDDFALGYVIKSMTLLDQGKFQEGIEAAKKAAKINSRWKYITVGMAYAKSGDFNTTKKIIAELENQPITPFNVLSLGRLYIEVGEVDKGLNWLKHNQKHAWYPWAMKSFMAKGLSDNPEYLELISEMNFPDPAPLVKHPG